jgi:hypothetical protein
MGSPVTGIPQNGVQYNYNNVFGTTGTEFSQPNEYVIHRGTNNVITVNNLLPSTTYYISVFEYNGSGATTEYLNIPLTGSQQTVSAPTTQAHSVSFSNVIGNSVRISWANGNGENRFVLARKGAPVNATPVDLTEYSTSSEWGSGAHLNGDNQAVSKGTGNSVTLTKLEPNTQYHFAVFEFNGNNTPVYLVPGATGTVTTLAGPTQPANSINLSSKEGDRFTLTPSGGNGSRKLYVLKKGSPVTGTPVNGTIYNASTAFGSGDQLGAGEYVISNTIGSVTVTNLEPSSTYFVRIFEYDVDGSNNTFYLTSSSASASYSTATAPTQQVSAIYFQNVTGSSMTVRYTGGNGNYRMLILKEGSPVDAEPMDLTRYNGNANFGTGDEIGTGNFVIQGGVNGTNIAVQNLQPGKTYHVAMHEFQGNNYPVYARPAATASITIPNQPTAPSTGMYQNTIEGNSIRVNWISGDGTRRIVIAKKGSAVTARPLDGTVYSANLSFGQGNEIAPAEFVVYDGTSQNAQVENLEINSTYHFAVFEYNLSATGPDYLTTAFLQGSGSTLAAPTTQVSNINAIEIQPTQVKFGFTMGNGDARLFLMKKGSPVDADPVDLGTYNSSPTFGLGTEVGTGNFVVRKSAGQQDFTVSGLQSNSLYHVAAYEYVGSSGMVFLRPAATFSFTTTPAAGDITPTLPSTSGTFTIIEGNKLRLNWENGNGANRVVVVRQGSAVSSNPINGITYTANASFGTGSELGTGEYVVYNGHLSAITVTNLLPGQTYHFNVYEYNGTGTTTSYLVSHKLTASAATVSAPGMGGSSLVATNTTTGIKIDWTNGNGSSRMVVMREEAAVAAIPSDLTAYPANNTFGNGSQIAIGHYVVYSGSGNSVTVTGLAMNRTYHFSIFEFNGSEAPVYNTVNAISGSQLYTSTLPVKWAYFTAARENRNVKLKWGTWQEENTEYFVVERNTGAGYETVSIIPAAGNSTTPRDYSYIDVLNSNATYRIKQVDFDGHFSYSQVVMVQKDENSQTFSVFPNPATNQITIKFNSQAATLNIVDTKGSVLKTQRVENNQTIDISRLPGGVYHLILAQEGSKQSQLILKR